MSFVATFPALVAGRLALSLTPLSPWLRHDHQLSSPLTSYTRLQEGVYLSQHDVDPYSGGVFRHSPLLLALFSTVLPLTPVLSACLWTASDAVGAWALVNIWRARSGVQTGSRDVLVAACYLLNPYIFLSTTALSTSTFENTLYLLAVLFASKGRASASLLALSFATHLSLPSSLFLPPLILLLLAGPASRLASPHTFQGNLQKGIPLVVEYVVYTGALAFTSTMVAGGWHWVGRTWGAGFTLPDLTPNPGFWWYYFTEMFDHFRTFYLAIYSLHLPLYVVPLCIKFQHDPLYATFIIHGLLAIFKPYPTMADIGLFFSSIALFPETFSYLQYPIVTTLFQLHAAILLPLFHHLWLATGTGNANFFYASTLVFGLANGQAVLDSLWAGLRIAMGEEKEGVFVVQE